MKNGLKINELQRQLTTLRNILSEYETETNRLKNNAYVSHYYNNDPEFYKNVRRNHLRIIKGILQKQIIQTKSIIRKLQREVDNSF